MERFSDKMVNALNFKNTAILFILCGLKVLWNGRSLSKCVDDYFEGATYG